MEIEEDHQSNMFSLDNSSQQQEKSGLIVYLKLCKRIKHDLIIDCDDEEEEVQNEKQTRQSFLKLFGRIAKFKEIQYLTKCNEIIFPSQGKEDEINIQNTSLKAILMKSLKNAQYLVQRAKKALGYDQRCPYLSFFLIARCEDSQNINEHAQQNGYCSY